MDIMVSYFPQAEVSAGLTPQSKTKVDSYQFGAEIHGPAPALPEWEMRLYGNYSWQTQELSVSSFSDSVDQGPYETLPQSMSGLDYSGNPLPPGSIFNVFGDGSANTAEVIANALALGNEGVAPSHDAKSAIWDLNFSLSGSMFELPAGPVNLAVGGEFRVSANEQARYPVKDPSGDPVEDISGSVFTNDAQTENQGVFVELFVPLVAPEKAVPFVHRLNFRAAARWSKITHTGTVILNEGDAGSSLLPVDASSSNTDPQFGVSWFPVESFEVRGTYGTSFLAPNPYQALQSTLLIDVSYPGLMELFFPDMAAELDGQPFNNWLFDAGGNVDLQPQSAETWTGSLIWTPISILRGLRVEATINKTEFDNYIGTPGLFFDSHDLYADPTIAGPVVTYDASTGTVYDSSLNLTNFVGRTQESYDFRVSYQTSSRFGEWYASINATRLAGLTTQISAESPVIDEAGTHKAAHPLSINSDMSLTTGHWVFALGVAYHDGFTQVNRPGYTDADGIFVSDPPDWEVGSYTTADVTIRYSIDDLWGALASTDLTLGVRDIFDADYPVYDSYSGIDTRVANLRGRTIQLGLQGSFGD